MTVRVLLLGGTGDARRLVKRLAADPKLDVTTALAGRVRTPRRNSSQPATSVCPYY
jgi:precorrin-6A/cobalt-precorrin-6A reductase